MTDLSALIPSHEPADDTLATVGGMALESIPLLGPLAGRALDHALATRERERRHEFDRAIVGELQRLAERMDETLTVADVVRSDEFFAALNYARRAAAETADDAKRQRLARAAAEAGPWSDFAASERAGFLRLVSKYDELHIWLLTYFADPVAWLDAHGLAHVHDGVNVGEIGEHVAEALDVGIPGDRQSDDVPHIVTDALEDLIGDNTMSLFSLASIRDRPFASQLTDRGRRFLAYLREESPADKPRPAL